MKKVTRDLIENFIVGGFVTASVSYIGTFMNPTLAAIWWSFPVSLLPSMYFMHQYGKDNKYIANFAFTTTFALVVLFLTTMLMAHYFQKIKDSFWKPVSYTVIGWIILSAIYYFIVKYFKLDNYF